MGFHGVLLVFNGLYRVLLGFPGIETARFDADGDADAAGPTLG